MKQLDVSSQVGGPGKDLVAFSALETRVLLVDSSDVKSQRVFPGVDLVTNDAFRDSQMNLPDVEVPTLDPGKGHETNVANLGGLDRSMNRLQVFLHRRPGEEPG